jgi:hypothetical protein
VGDRYLTDLAAVLRAAGQTVYEEAGWQTRARSSGGFDPGQPCAIVVHHTASSTNPANDVAYICHGAEYAPISQLLLDRTGVWWVCAAGAANHAGAGGPWGPLPLDGANARTIGIEAANAGTGEPWPESQQSAYVAGCAALCAAYAIDPANIACHSEWAPGRKIDPAGPSRWAPAGGTWPGDAFRASVADAAGTGVAGPLTQRDAYDVVTLWYVDNVAPDVVGPVVPPGDPGAPITTQTALYDVLTLWHTANPGVLDHLTAATTQGEPMSTESDAAHLERQVSWLAQWITKTAGTLTPVIGVGDYTAYGGAPLTSGPFVRVSEQIAGLVTVQRTLDTALSAYAADNGLEVSPGATVLDETGWHYAPGEHPIPPE